MDVGERRENGVHHGQIHLPVVIELSDGDGPEHVPKNRFRPALEFAQALKFGCSDEGGMSIPMKHGAKEPLDQGYAPSTARWFYCAGAIYTGPWGMHRKILLGIAGLLAILLASATPASLPSQTGQPRRWPWSHEEG